jgi:hypothetical protein
MSSGLASLHKILKDETRSKAILLLNEKEAMSYTDLMDELGIVSTGLLNYHLNLIHGTNFSGGAIDVEYPIGYAATLFVAMFSIVVGLVARISAFIHRRNRTKNAVDGKTHI